jgi:hydrogenase maturation protease
VNAARIEAIAAAVLYEGYNLYPYRPSAVKNRQRWTFGGVCPRVFSQARGGSDAWTLGTECLATAGDDAVLDVKLRFLHPLTRTVGELTPPLADLPRGAEPAYRLVEAFEAGDRLLQPWEEAVEREVSFADLRLGDLLREGGRHAFAFPAWRSLEPVPGPDGAIVAVLVREQQAIAGELEVSATTVQSADGEDGVQIAVRVSNLTSGDAMAMLRRDEAMLHSLVSTHVVLGLRGGEFVSSIDPPALWREAVALCQNAGLWPVLVGDEGERDAMLAAPIILYDYPQVAPESPGDLFDGTEIDEILTLRIMTLTDEERQAVRGSDARTRALLDRTDALPPEQLAKLHGALRGMRPPEAER